MTNYQAIMKMDETAMEKFLDQVFLTGLNTGTYEANHPDKVDIHDDNPFSAAWLNAPAEQATRNERTDDGDGYLLNSLAAAVLRSAGIEPEKESDVP